MQSEACTFFSWEGGFVCTGPNAKPTEEPWLADVLETLTI